LNFAPASIHCGKVRNTAMPQAFFWTVLSATILARCALADDLIPLPPETISATPTATTNVVLASVVGNQVEDPFASQQPDVAPEWGDQEINNGKVHFSFDFAYSNRYLYRGVDHDSVASHSNSLNLLFDGKLQFDLGKYPHPYVEVFTNIYDSDPVSRFQEVRPIIGANWDLKPFDIDLCEISYIYPERESFNYPEIDLKLTLDDNLIFNTEEPVFSPYVLGAFEYQKYEGWYIETGLKHDFMFEDFGLVLTPQVCVAWISGLKQQFVFINTVASTGWQHFEAGLSMCYSLNHLLDVSTKYGEFDVKGYGYYDDALTRNITASNAFWGGIGLGFRY
jgi:hypothetical protein